MLWWEGSHVGGIFSSQADPLTFDSATHYLSQADSLTFDSKQVTLSSSLDENRDMPGDASELSVVTFGSNSHGQCRVPDEVEGNRAVEVSCGEAHTVVRMMDGSVIGFGACCLVVHPLKGAGEHSTLRVLGRHVDIGGGSEIQCKDPSSFTVLCGTKCSLV
eukprot:3622891-Amphidinium_carterae.1